MTPFELHCLSKRDALIARLARTSVHNSELGCRKWTGKVINKGYGRTNIKYQSKDKSMLVHRLSLLLFTGKSVEGYQVDHRCCNKRCIHPEHLVACFPTENRLLQTLRSGEPDEDILLDPDKDIPYPWPGQPVVKYSRCPF